jgi:hypothetical protein
VLEGQPIANRQQDRLQICAVFAAVTDAFNRTPNRGYPALGPGSFDLVSSRLMLFWVAGKAGGCYGAPSAGYSAFPFSFH